MNERTFLSDPLSNKNEKRNHLWRIINFHWYVTFILFLFFSSSNAQWFWQNPLPQGNGLLSLCNIDSITCVAVGRAGTIIKTTDGGETWTFQNSGTKALLLDVFFKDKNNGIIVGSDDWTGGLVLRTTDGGNSWVRQQSGTTWPLGSVFFSDEYNGTAVGFNGIVVRTTDGGSNWMIQQDNTNQWFHDVYFFNSLSGIAVGEGGVILRTTDGGANWFSQESGVTSTNTLNSIAFIDAFNGAIVGDNGIILRTTNGGDSWNSEYSETNIDLRAISYGVNSNLIT